MASTLLLAGPAAANHPGDLDCADFDSQAAAQAHFRDHPGDPDGLDADEDWIACENHTTYSDPSTDMTPVGAEGPQVEETDDDDNQVSPMPEDGVDAGGGSTAGMENTELLLAGGIALTVGAGGLILASRRTARD